MPAAVGHRWSGRSGGGESGFDGAGGGGGRGGAGRGEASSTGRGGRGQEARGAEGRAGQEGGGGGTSGSRMAEAAHAFFLLWATRRRWALRADRISPLHLCGLNCGDSRVGGAGLPSGLAAKPAPLASVDVP